MRIGKSSGGCSELAAVIRGEGGWGGGDQEPLPEGRHQQNLGARASMIRNGGRFLIVSAIVASQFG